MVNESTRFETITWERKGEIGLLTFNRPERYNAISYQLMDEVADVLDSLKYDTENQGFGAYGCWQGILFRN